MVCIHIDMVLRRFCRKPNAHFRKKIDPHSVCKQIPSKLPNQKMVFRRGGGESFFTARGKS